MEIFNVNMVVQAGGRILLENLPFPEGTKVTITIRRINKTAKSTNTNPIRGTLIRYDNPFEPAVAPEDWEANR